MFYMAVLIRKAELLFSLVEHDLLKEVKSMWKYVCLNHSFWPCIDMIIMVPSGPGG
jgi:hypothetical protein